LGRFFRVVGVVVSHAAVVRVVAAFGLFVVAEYAVWIGMLVYAFHHGGATASGLVATAQLLPGVLIAPLLAVVADRRSPTLLLAVGYVAQAVAMAGVAVALFMSAPPLVAYALAVVASTAMCTTRPAQSAVLPSTARVAQELTAANVVTGWAENFGIVLSAAIAAIFLKIGQIGWLFAVSAAFVGIAAVLVVPVRVAGIAVADETDDQPGVNALFEGFVVTARDERARLLTGLLSAQWVVVGALDILFVVLAVDVLHQGQAWVGYLNAAYGIGAVAAGALTAHLLGWRLSQVIGLSVLALGAALILTGFFHVAVIVVLLIAVVGAGRAVLFVAASTLLQRVVPAQVVGRVFGVVEGLSNLGLAVGSLLPALLIYLGGDRFALIVIGGLLPAAGVLGLRALRRLDRGRTVPIVEVALLRSLPHFADLPAPGLETLAGELECVRVLPGEVVIRQGDEGDRFYAIADGEVAVSVDGHLVTTLRRGEGFGEVALLRNSPRNATVTAIGPVTLFALDGANFLTVVAGHAPTRNRAEDIAALRDSADPKAHDGGAKTHDIEGKSYEAEAKSYEAEPKTQDVEH
jgi:MFS family permease